MKKKQKAYDKGVEDGRKQMLDEFMELFYKKLADDTKKQIDEYVESFTWDLKSEPKNSLKGFGYLFNNQLAD